MAKKRKKKKKKNSRFNSIKKKQNRSHLVYYEYTITDEPILLNKIPVEIEDEVEELYYEVQEKPQETIKRLEFLVQQYPHVPQLYNYLSIAYSGTGKSDKAEEVAKINYQKNPDYLFAKLNYAEICLNNNELDKIPEIFENKYELKMLYPKRDIFHISEVVNFYGVIGLYFSHIGNLEQAMICLRSLKDLDPEHPATQRLSSKLIFSSLENKISRLLKRREMR